MRSLSALILLLSAGCDLADPMAVFRPAPVSAHERYGNALIDAGLDSTALGREWLAASDSAVRAPFGASLPIREVGAYSRHEARAVAYRVALRDGQQLRVSLRSDGPSARVYLDLFEVTADSAQPFVLRATADTLVTTDSLGSHFTLQHETRRNGEFVLRLQPELLRSGRYELVIETEPSLAFPVMDASNRSIQSFFGAGRDAGRRVHHGIDIFAPRGTPALAATDGTVRNVNPNNLGGIVVWLSDTKRGQSLYYAHLDSQIVRAGQTVRRGDTLGFVGNTGNARTTAPHLHFGIYRRGEGPIDPLLHVRYSVAPVPAVRADTARLGTRGVVVGATVNLRDEPSISGALLREVPRATEVDIMAASATWYRVQFDDGSSGYVVASAVRPLPN